VKFVKFATGKSLLRACDRRRRRRERRLGLYDTDESADTSTPHI